jgi:molybdenum cofactor synthesis domain-containing protein
MGGDRPPVVQHHVDEEALVALDDDAARHRLREKHGGLKSNGDQMFDVGDPAMTMTASERVTAAVLIIGDEILSGRTQDVNLNAIAKYLATYGVDVCEVRIVPDIEQEIVDAVNALRTRYDYVVTTGGIGPTHDDITADSVAKAFGVDGARASRDHGHAARALGRAQRRPPPHGPRARGRQLVKNPVQGPPGFQIGNVFVLAGVPAIMRGMLDDVGPRLRTGAVVISRTVRVTGTGEGTIAAPLEAVAKAHPDLSIGSYPFFAPPDVYGASLVIRGRDPAEVDAAVEELVAALEAAEVKGIERLEAGGGLKATPRPGIPHKASGMTTVVWGGRLNWAPSSSGSTRALATLRIALRALGVAWP